MARYQIQGITDERDCCDCCGRTNLKRTVVLSDIESGEFVFFGTTCAARAMKWTVKAVRQGVKSAEEAKRKVADEERRRVAAARSARWVAYLIARTGGIYEYDGSPNLFRMIQALGGYAAARGGFNTKEQTNP